MIRHLYLFVFLLFGLTGFAQQRYHQEVFPQVIVTTDVQYAQNFTVLSGTPVLSDLYMDVYEPIGDTLGSPFYESERPVVIVAHGGNFFPAVYNGNPFGTKDDSAVVELCNRLSRRGYVAIAVSYRLGWNPLSSDSEVRRASFFNALYRGMLDLKSCTRFIRWDVDSNSNTFHVDTSKIAVGGFGSGGAMALAHSSIDDFNELMDPMFLDFTDPGNVLPYIDTTIVGNLKGLGGSASMDNHPSYSSDVNMVFNIRGWMPDTMWIDSGEIPIVGIQCMKDVMYTVPFFPGGAPYGYPFSLARGNHGIMKRVNGVGNNAIFANIPFTDLYSLRAAEINEGFSGLYPFVLPDPGSNTCSDGSNTFTEDQQISPWNWWDTATYISAANAVGKDGQLENCRALLINPDMSPEKGRLCIDTILGYLNPRMICVLGLPYCGTTLPGIEESRLEEPLEIYPNPASNTAIIQFRDLEIGVNNQLVIYDLAGRKMSSYELANGQLELEVNLESFDAGMYIVRLSSSSRNTSNLRIVVSK